MRAFVEVLRPAQEELADPVERIALAPAVPEGLVLDSPTHRIDHPVGGTDDVEGVGHLDGVVKVAGDGAPIALGEIGGRSTASPRTCRQLRRGRPAGEGATIRFHDLRDGWATMALRAGVSPKIVSERLGHASIVITLDTYSHVLPACRPMQLRPSQVSCLELGRTRFLSRQDCLMILFYRKC
jgi:hypothetical protein